MVRLESMTCNDLQQKCIIKEIKHAYKLLVGYDSPWQHMLPCSDNHETSDCVLYHVCARARVCVYVCKCACVYACICVRVNMCDCVCLYMCVITP